MADPEEERRAKNAAKQREYRARKKAEQQANTDTVGNAKAEPVTPTMENAVTQSIAHMRWLVASDIASKTQAVELAKQVDLYTAQGDYEKALTAHRVLSRVLADLGGTPIVRMQQELRSLRLQPKVEGGDGRNSKAATHGNVSKFERPSPRAR